MFHKLNNRMDRLLNRNEQSELKVIFLTSSYPRTWDDSASVFLRYLAEHLSKLNITIHVLAPADAKSGTTGENEAIIHRFRYFPRPWQKLAYGSGILSNLKRNPLLWLQVPFFMLAMSYAMLRLIHKYKPHIIHAHWVIPQGIIAVFLAKYICRTPVIITVHGGDTFALRGYVLKRLKRFCLRKCNAWTSNTLVTANAVGFGSFPSPHIIPMGVNINQFSAGKHEKLRTGISANEYIILYVGRLVEKKGVDDLINAFSLLPDNLKTRTHLWIVGSGEHEARLRVLASQLGVTNKTKFWGRIPNHLLPDYYAAADLFVGPSVVAESGDTEGQGVVFLEAFASRLCVLSTNTGGIASVVEDGLTGILIEPRNPAQLAKMMEKLLDNKALRTTLATRAYDKVKKNYKWERIATDFKSLYKQVLK